MEYQPDPNEGTGCCLLSHPVVCRHIRFRGMREEDVVTSPRADRLAEL